MKSGRLKKIIEENKKFEEKSPYNFCDRWCQRCSHDKQMRCKLYHDEFEREATCIAYGREPDDPEIVEDIMKQEFEGIEERLEKFMEENQIDIDDIDSPAFGATGEQIGFLENNQLSLTAEQYCKKVDRFLKDTFYNKEGISPKLKYHFETVAWYHTLLLVKLHRVLDGLHEPVSEDDFALYDAVAQLAVCRKAINESDKALRVLKRQYPAYKNLIIESLSLLHNILSRMEIIEANV